MRILYGVSGEGLGHATRSKVIIDHLRKKHEVCIVAGGSAYIFLNKFFPDVKEIYSFRLIYKKNKVHNFRTLLHAMKNYPRGRSKSLDILYSLVVSFRPELIITDFEYFTDTIAGNFDIPCISIDNNHIVSACLIDVPMREYDSYIAARSIIGSFIRNVDHYFITTFFYPKKRKTNVSLFPPVLRESILDIKPKSKDHVFVYQTTSNEKLLSVLQQIDETFIVYGFGKAGKIRNVTFKKFNEKQFYEDIGNCKAVITNGGFTLMSESLHLKKPVLSIPLGNQFEQICNAIYLEKLGYGAFAEEVSADSIEEFLRKLPLYRKHLKKFKASDNSKLFKALDSYIEKITPED